MKRNNDNYKRGLTDNKFDEALKDCIDKMEGLNDLDWEDIVEKYDLNIHRDVLRKAFTSPLGGYSIYRRMKEREVYDANSSILDKAIQEIGELEFKKQEVRDQSSKLRKLKKDFIKSKEISQDIMQNLCKDMNNLFPDYTDYCIIPNSDKKMVVCISDWHIGYTINNYKGNTYNYTVAKKRLEYFLDEIYKTAAENNISDILIANSGDIIENAYMRENQSYECEFNLSEQISKAIKLLWWFIASVSSFANVEVITVGGNHSRATTLKTANIEGDNSNIIIKEQLEMLVDITNNNRVRILDVDYVDDSATFEYYGKKYKVLHGDNRLRDPKKMYDAECSIDNTKYEAIIMGHYHNFNVSSQNNGAKVIVCGCLFGYNPYSVKRMGCSTNASQEILILDENGINTIKDVNLQK